MTTKEVRNVNIESVISALTNALLTANADHVTADLLSHVPKKPIGGHSTAEDLRDAVEALEPIRKVIE